MALRRGVPAHLRHQPLRRRRPVLDRFPLRRPRRDRRSRRHPERRGAAARHVRLPRRAWARNGADIFRVAVGLTETDTWWRVDWNTLLDPSVPIALFTFDTDRGQATTDDGRGRWRPLRRHRPCTARFGPGARLIDLTTDASTPVEHTVDMASRSFLARIPRSMVEPTGTWTVRLAAGLANDEGDGFADVPLTRGAKPGQPNVYNLAFRTHEQEKAHLNFWSDEAQADALTDGDVSEFSLAVRWDHLPIASPPMSPSSEAPRRGGTSRRSSWDRASPTPAVEHRPRFPRPGAALLGVPSRDVRPRPQVAADAAAALTCVGPEPVRRHRPAAAAPDLRRPGLGGGDAAGPRSLVLVFRRGRARRLGGLGAGGRTAGHRPQPHRDRGLLDGRLRRLQTGADLSGGVRPGCGAGGPRPAACDYCPTSTFPATWTRTRIVPARATPSAARQRAVASLRHRPRRADQLVPVSSVLFQVHELDRLAYRYRFTLYPTEDHITWVAEDDFDDPVSHMGTGPRQGDPGHITFTWYPQLVRPDLGIGPHQVWWLSDLTADPDTTATRGARASVDARSHARPNPRAPRGGVVASNRTSTSHPACTPSSPGGSGRLSTRCLPWR